MSLSAPRYSTSGNGSRLECLICYNKFEKSVGRPLSISQKVFSSCCKHLHDAITKETLKNKWDPKSQKQLPFCQQCFDAALELSQMTDQLEEFQKTVNDLILTFSLTILHRRSQNQDQLSQIENEQRSSSDKRKFEIDATGFPFAGEEDLQSDYASVNNFLSMSLFQDNCSTPDVENLEVKCELPCFEMYQTKSNSNENDCSLEDEAVENFYDGEREYFDDQEEEYQQPMTSTNNTDDSISMSKINKIIRDKYQTQNPEIKIQNMSSVAELKYGTDGRIIVPQSNEYEKVQMLPLQNTKRRTSNSSSSVTQHIECDYDQLENSYNSCGRSEKVNMMTDIAMTQVTKVASSKSFTTGRNNSSSSVSTVGNRMFVKMKTPLKRPKVSTSSEFLYKCRYCFKGFPDIPMLRFHERTHLNENNAHKKYKCPKCEKRFNSRSNMGSHMKIHIGKKSFTCDYCSYATYWLSNLKTHYRIHTGEHPYKCSNCECQFKTYQTGVSHFKKSHPECEFSKGCLIRKE